MFSVRHLHCFNQLDRATSVFPICILRLRFNFCALLRGFSFLLIVSKSRVFVCSKTSKFSSAAAFLQSAQASSTSHCPRFYAFSEVSNIQPKLRGFIQNDVSSAGVGFEPTNTCSCLPEKAFIWLGSSLYGDR